MENFFPQNLRYLRKSKNITQFEISTLVAKASNTIGNWEKEISEPNIGEIIKLVKYFNVSIDDLILKDLLAVGSVNYSKAVVKEEPKPSDENTTKLMASQQLNIETLQKLLTIKEDELEKLRIENSILKGKRNTPETVNGV